MARKPTVNTTPDAEQIAAATEAGLIPVVRVVGPAEGRRRAGHHFGADAVDVPLADLTEDQIVALQADPKLLVTITAVPAEPQPEPSVGD